MSKSQYKIVGLPRQLSSKEYTYQAGDTTQTGDEASSPTIRKIPLKKELVYYSSILA